MRFPERIAAVAVVVVVVVVVVVWPPPAEGCRMAIGYRDNVPIEQQVGSWAWTLPWLLVGYDEVELFTATASDDKRAAWSQSLDDAAADRCEVDLFIFAHGNDYASWIEGVSRRPALRLVYDTGAGDARQGPRWIDAGARAFVGHPGGNIAPVWFAFFLPEWMIGETVDDATAIANDKTCTFIDTMGLDDGARLKRSTQALTFGDGKTTR
jgi:hypothetical protein